MKLYINNNFLKLRCSFYSNVTKEAEPYTIDNVQNWG